MCNPPPFTETARERIADLDLDVTTFAHPSGARHIHLDCDDEHLAFAAAFRTQPTDHTGLPHILEHTTLCGSARFPVRDPFFMMIRRSLQTFMNAMTYNDRTCYPFSSQVSRDFFNLLDVYLDAVFAPNLHRLDFAQEGWRLAPDDEGWTIKGVVFNEMKGATGNTDAQLNQALCSRLLPDTCYAWNSGGEPLAIPGLDHADLVAFQRRCYGAANACFVSYGAVDIDTLQARLSAYCEERPGEALPVPAAQPPLELGEIVPVPVPCEAQQDRRDVCTAAHCWNWGDGADPGRRLLGRLVDHLLLGHPGAPLRLALDRSGLGRSIEGSGLSTFVRNAVFSVELAGILPPDYAAFDELVPRSLAEIRDAGFAADEVEAAIDQLELSHRRIGGDRYPFGVQLCLRAVEAWNYGLPATDLLDIAAPVAALREACADPSYLPGVVQERLLDNRHRVVLHADPDPDFNRRQEERLRELVDARLADLDAAERKVLAEDARRLDARQGEEDDPEVLPRLEAADIPPARRFPEPEDGHDGVRVFRVRSNQVAFETLALPLGVEPPGAWTRLASTVGTFGQLGCGDRDYIAQAKRIDRLCGGLDASLHLTARPEDPTRGAAYLLLDGHGLAARFPRFAGLLPEILHGQRFDEWTRLQELAGEELAHLQQAVRFAGHRLAIHAALRGAAGRAGLGHDLHGIGRLLALKELAETRRDDADGWREVGRTLASVHERLAAAPVLRCLVCSEGLDELVATAAAAWADQPSLDAVPADELSLPGGDVPPPTAYVTATQVSYNAMVLPAVGLAHPDAPALAVGCRILAHRFLHNRIRERGGAYGSGASFDPGSGHIRFMTYRDPRLDGSFADFAAGCSWLTELAIDADMLEEAVLGTIAAIDAPASPAGEARSRFLGLLDGRDPATINAFRRAVLGIDAATVRQTAARYLDPARGRVATVTSPAAAAASERDWRVVEL